MTAVNYVLRLLNEYDGDVDRIMYLYSDTSSRSEETVTFWRKGVEAFCNDQKSFKLTPSEISIRFIYKDMVPTSIDNSLAILRSRKEIVDIDKFSNPTIFQALTSSAAGWLGSMLMSSEMNEKSLSTKEVIFVPLLKAVTEAFIKYMMKECEANRDQLLVVYATQYCNMSNLDLSFSHLLRDAGQKMNPPSPETGTVKISSLSVRPKPQGSPTNTAVGLMLQQMEDSSMCILEDYMVSEGYAVRSADRKILKIMPVKKEKDNKNGKVNMQNSQNDVTPNSVIHGSVVTDVDVARLKLQSSISQLEKRITALDAQAASHKEKAVGFKVRESEYVGMMMLLVSRFCYCFFGTNAHMRILTVVFPHLLYCSAETRK
jgi:hypothetical protein